MPSSFMSFLIGSPFDDPATTAIGMSLANVSSSGRSVSTARRDQASDFLSMSTRQNAMARIPLMDSVSYIGPRRPKSNPAMVNAAWKQRRPSLSLHAASTSSHSSDLSNLGSAFRI